ncbi:helix-turn-helix transcriptional regulator [Lactiplantibacillus plantarum]|nr:helix-turn-helix transcriptional regulator [Lactiplantibacillus plantarum]
MAQKNKLQFIILGLLNQQPLTGYDLTKAFDDEIGEFWQAQHSQIYPQLKRLEEQGTSRMKLRSVAKNLRRNSTTSPPPVGSYYMSGSVSVHQTSLLRKTNLF